MTQGISFGGLVSGLDSASLIRQLIAFERRPIVQLEQRQAELRKVDDAWGQVNTKLSALRTAVDKVRRTTSFGAFTSTTSSKADAVAATKTGTPATGSLTFTVNRLASVHQTAEGATFADPTAKIGSGHTFSITKGGETKTITTTDTTTYADLAAAVDGLGLGVTGQVVKVADGSHRLVLASKETGAAQAFTTSTTITGLQGQIVLRQGADAELSIGEGAGALTVTRSSNVVTDLVDGVRLDLKQAGQTVTVSTARDIDAATTAIKEYVDTLNGVLSTLKDLSKYDAATKKGGALQGDSTARQIANDLRNAVASAVDGVTGQYTYPGAIGISLDRYGAVTLDETKLKDALTNDFDGVAGLLSRSGSTTDARAAFVTAGDKTVSGTYSLTISRAAQVAAVTGATFSGGEPKTFTITADDGNAVSVSLDGSEDAATAVAKINNALLAANVGTVKASVDSGTGGLRLEETRYGSGISFNVAATDGTATVFGLEGTHMGTDVAGTLTGAGGTVYSTTGSGQTLTGAAGTPVEGLLVSVSAGQSEVDAAGGNLALGSVTTSGGFGGKLSTLLGLAEGSDGSVARARKVLTNQIDDYQDSIDAFEVRIASRETTLRLKFAALETALNRVQGQSQALVGLFANLR
jgi:flagellar hook-associated protein 2